MPAFVLKNLCEELGMELIAVHVNHGIRGEEAMEDQRFVENLCERLGVKIRICSGKVPELAKAEKLSEEEAGRIFRRQCFEKICKEEKADKIVLAHHRDDNAETFLFHLSRGSGLKGAGGMRPVNGSYVRPLLGVGRKEIESWLEEQHISWRTDATNLEDEYTRNRIRHQILPTLETQVNAKGFGAYRRLDGADVESSGLCGAGSDSTYGSVCGKSAGLSGKCKRTERKNT